MIDAEVTGAVRTELEAAEQGYTRLRQEVAEFLGPSSVAALTIEQQQAEIDKNRDNLALIENFTRSLPLASRSTFKLREDGVQVRAREIQAHVLWLDQGSMLTGGRYVSPFYVIGRKSGEPLKDTESVLLVSADKFDPGVEGIGVYREDMRAWGTLAESIKGREFTEEQIERAIDPKTGAFNVAAWTNGSVRVRQPGPFRSRKKRAPENVEKYGIRSTRFSDFVLHAISAELIAEYNVPEAIAKLAYSFGIEQELKKLIANDTPAELEPGSD
jgi:hypothetical protein